MYLLDAVAVCSGDLKSIWKLIGQILFIFKIAVPLLIIIFGAIDLGKAVVASKDDEIKKAAKSLMFRALAGVFIFFIPTLVGFIFTLVDGWSTEYQGEYSICAACISNPGGDGCNNPS